MTESQITDAIELLQFPYLESKGGGEVMKGIEIGVRAMVGRVEILEKALEHLRDTSNDGDLIGYISQILEEYNKK